MFKRRICNLLVVGSVALLGVSAVAQSNTPWSKWNGPRIVDKEGAGAALTPPVLAGSQQPPSALRVEGTWELNEVFAPGGSDPSLYTFSAGPDADHGTMVMSDTFIFTGNPSCITAQGAWQRIGDRSFVGKHKCFAFDDFNGFQPAGWVIWRFAVTISQDGNSMFGRAVLDFYDQDGNYLFSAPCALTGTRMNAGAPPR